MMELGLAHTMNPVCVGLQSSQRSHRGSCHPDCAGEEMGTEKASGSYCGQMLEPAPKPRIAPLSLYTHAFTALWSASGQRWAPFSSFHLATA